MENEYFNKFMAAGILISLVILSFFLIKPILMSIITGIILAFIFFPIYDKLVRVTKSQNLSATILSVLLIILVILPLWFITPIAIDQAVKVYFISNELDFVGPMKAIFPSLFASDTFSVEAGNMISNFVTGITNSLAKAMANLILNFPIIFLQLIVVLFTFYFVLRDKDRLFGFMEDLSPFSEKVNKKLSNSSAAITKSVLYGQIIIGLIMGIIMGIGFFVFSVPNALLLTLIATLAGVLPIIGTMLVWLPVMIYLFIQSNTFAAVGILIFGLISSNIDNFLRPLFVSKKVRMPSSVIMIGMIGGFLFFGVLGLILGPLIIAYLLILIENYQSTVPKKSKFFIEESKERFFLNKLIR